MLSLLWLKKNQALGSTFSDFVLKDISYQELLLRKDHAF